MRPKQEWFRVDSTTSYPILGFYLSYVDFCQGRGAVLKMGMSKLGVLIERLDTLTAFLNDPSAGKELLVVWPWGKGKDKIRLNRLQCRMVQEHEETIRVWMHENRKVEVEDEAVYQA